MAIDHLFRSDRRGGEVHIGGGGACGVGVWSAQVIGCKVLADQGLYSLSSSGGTGERGINCVCVGRVTEMEYA